MDAAALVAKLSADSSAPLERAEADAIVAWLKSLKEPHVGPALNSIGNLARQESYRQPLGEAGAPEAAAAFLDGADAALALRVIGNLAFDHPDNRAAAGRAGVVPKAVALLKSATPANAELAKNAAGCIANLSSESEALQAEVASHGGLPALVAVLTMPAPVPMMALRALNNLLDSEPARTAFAATPNSIIAVVRALHPVDIPALDAHRPSPHPLP